MFKSLQLKGNYTLLLVSLFFSINVYSQIVNIPDPVLKNALTTRNVVDTTNNNIGDSNADLNGDGEIQISEALQVRMIDLGIVSNTINSLQGIEAFQNMEAFYASYNQISSFPIMNSTSLTELRLSSNNLTSIDLSMLPNLSYLDLEYNNLSSLNILSQTSLTELYLSSNSLTNLDLTNNISLTNLKLDSNPITTLDLSTNTLLSELFLMNTQLTSLDLSAQNSMFEVWIDNTPLNSLTGLSNLTISSNLVISSTNLTSIQMNNVDASSALVDIFYNNQLTSIDIVDTKVLYFNLSSNNSLNTLNQNNFDCQNLNISYNNFFEIDFSDNPYLNSLDISNEYNLQEINLNNTTNLSSVGINDSVKRLFLKNGQNETLNLYQLTNLEYVCADNDDFQNITNAINSSNSGNLNFTMNSYCTFTPGGIPYLIEGEVRVDADLNGCSLSDLNEVDFKFNITDNTTNESGTYFITPSFDYDIFLRQGNYTIVPQPLIHQSLFSPLTSFNANLDSSNTLITQDICITPTGNNIDLSVIMIEDLPARPGFDSDYKIICKNKGLTATTGTLYLNYDDSRLDYISTDLAFLSDSNGTIIWDIPSLEPNEEIIINITFNVNTPMETPAVNGGDILFYGGTISGPTGIQDTNTSNDTFEYPQTVVNSYDPNDITCLEGAILDPANIGEDLHYKIRFENTGTASAINVVIKNTIDTSRLDITSFQPLTSSHPMRTRITDGNVVEFIFENINLDFNDATNDGYLIYKIQSLPTLQLGDMIGNQAEIYFDFNFPIITNDYMVTVNQTASLNDVNSNSVSLFPNPSYGKVTINSSSYIQAIQIFDHLGRKVKSLSVKQENLEMNIDISELNTGLYFIKVKNESGEQSMKLIKE
ncbi:MAG: T9SS type A sorting domain-containing protein [Nonlabens ulvanivorans]|uniref:T9SS type A sorting domain-containing protein n=1 Tax=Nonlabens ulvanivorans TaxID=906888 RepID=UPI003299D46B